MTIILHGMMLSPPVRAVCLTCESLGVPYELKEVNLLERGHLEPEYLKLNPLHTVPTIQDGDFVLFESHAIVAYLADKYGQESWYPKDLKKRATINTRLHFNNGILFTRIRDLLEPVIFGGQKSFDPVKVQRLKDSLDHLEKLIGDNQWVAGDSPTIADCCCASTVSSIVNILPSHPVPAKVAAWLGRCEKTLPKFETANKKPAAELGQFVNSFVTTE